jgi:hypothetical protein
MCDVLDCCHSTAIAVFVHDACVQGHMAVTIWITCTAYAVILQISFWDAHPCLDGIQRSPVLRKYLPASVIGRYAKIPGRNDAR